MASILGEATVQELREQARGEVVVPSDESYETVRSVWNGMVDRRPALILRCAGVADVMLGVQFARSQGLDLAVRGGGHSLPGFSSTDGGIVLDLSTMKGIRVDPDEKRAIVQPGATWGDLDHETQAFGLATTGGLVSTTGIAGLTLGGGIGWLMRRHGLACDNLVSADVVTADGRLVRASDEENRDLLWALRAVAETSGSSCRSDSGCTRSARSCSPVRSSSRGTRPPRWRAATASTPPIFRTR
jgi:FAD/FMN-containing dehydrogenase